MIYIHVLTSTTFLNNTTWVIFIKNKNQSLPYISDAGHRTASWTAIPFQCIYQALQSVLVSGACCFENTSTNINNILPALGFKQ